MVNGNSGAVGIASDFIDGIKGNFFDIEGILGDQNILGMERPLAMINIAGTLRKGGGILPSLQTGVKKMTAGRKGGNPGNPPQRRYRPPTGQITRDPQPPAPNGNIQPARTEILL